MCKKVLSTDVEINPGPSFVNYSNTVRGTFDQGNEWLFGNNAGNQCVANSLIAVVFHAGINCFSWDRCIVDRILLIGNSFYGYLKKCTGKDRLLLSELPSELSIDNECYILTYGESMAGEVNMLIGRDCYFSLFEALTAERFVFSLIYHNTLFRTKTESTFRMKKVDSSLLVRLHRSIKVTKKHSK